MAAQQQLRNLAFPIGEQTFAEVLKKGVEPNISIRAKIRSDP